MHSHTQFSFPTLSPPQIPKWTRFKQSMLLRSPHKIENPEGTPRHSQTSGEDRRQSPGSLAARPVVREEHSLCISSKPAARWLPRVREDDRKCGYGHDKGEEFLMWQPYTLKVMSTELDALPGAFLLWGVNRSAQHRGEFQMKAKWEAFLQNSNKTRSFIFLLLLTKQAFC